APAAARIDAAPSPVGSGSAEAAAELLAERQAEALADVSGEAIDVHRVERLLAAAPGLDAQVLVRALQAHACARARGELDGPNADRLVVVDYSLPSTDERLWVLDLATSSLLFHERVAHGQGSGGDRATAFSNADGSHQSSLGV